MSASVSQADENQALYGHDTQVLYIVFVVVIVVASGAVLSQTILPRGIGATTSALYTVGLPCPHLLTITFTLTTGYKCNNNP